MEDNISYEIKCKFCNRFLGKATKSMEAEIKCSSSKCKKMNKQHIVFLSDYMKKHNHPHNDK